MNMNNIHSASKAPRPFVRRGSTLVIVIALLGLLAFTGMVFFSFATSERSAAEYFSEAAKGEIDDPDNVWDHPLRHIISGPSNRPSERFSILRSRDRRLSMVANMVGSDLTPHSGEGVTVAYNGAGLPVVVGTAGNDWIEFVDSRAYQPGIAAGTVTSNEDRSITPPAPDVDYTYPDINNLFLAYKGWAIRDNDPSNTGTISPRYERVPVIIPSFFRPQYMKSVAAGNGFSGNTAPADINWASAFDGTDRTTAKFDGRSFRPNPRHIVGDPNSGAWVFRFLTDTEAAALGITSGGFPFLPEDNLAGQPGGLNGVRGELGIWTGSDPGAYELDADNDGDGIREGIWIDTHFPIQEAPDGTLYTVLHSFTIYDLDGLINLNVHGNLAGLSRSGNVQTIAGSGLMEQQFLSKSNLGLGPNEINPLWALRTNLAAAASADVLAQFTHHYGSTPTNNVEQANMEFIWLMAGRAQIDTGGQIEDLFPGRWGENERLFNAFKPGGTFLVADLPRPGRPGDAQATGSSGIRFGGTQTGVGRNGFDDNQDRTDGEINPGLGRVRAFGTPMDWAGTGRLHQGTVGDYAGSSFPATGDIRLPLMHHDTTLYTPERFQGFTGYSLMRNVDTSYHRYFMGQNGAFDQGGDDLIDNVFYDALFEDPLECVFDPELSDRDFDRIFGPQDLIAMHLTAADLASSPDDISERMKDLAPYALDDANAPFTFNEQVTPSVRSRFTTLSNTLHRFLMRTPASATANRAWEFSADSDGADTTGDGLPDGDGNLEFPPKFGTIDEYSALDPFRPQVRRLMTVEVGENRALVGQMPLSPNHILDVERNAQTPPEGTPRFLYYMQRAGLRFRPLTDHPLASEAATITTIPVYTPASPVAFPPQTVGEREFWARRDRQKLARDIYVLLYTTGGAGTAGGATTVNYSTMNDPDAAEGSSLYTHEQLRRMAQFAVNMVDAMDSDNVMTKFEYDKNLGNGWNLDDDAFTADFGAAGTAAQTRNGLYPDDNATGGVVWGVEAQELAFSEVLGIHSNNPSMDHASTPFDDSSVARDFLYMELQNLRPTAQTLGDTASTTAATALWRLARYDRDPASLPPGVGDPAAPDESIAILQHAQNIIDGGGRFSIAVASDNSLASSSFFVDLGDPAAGTFDGTYELVAPDASGVTLPTTPNTSGSADPGYVPLADIDVIHDDHDGTNGTARAEMSGTNFLDALVDYGGNTTFETANGDVGTFDPVTGTLGFDLVLQRRANPNMPSLNDVTDNPWVEVDRIRVTFDQFAIADGDLPTAIYNESPDAGDPTKLNRGGYLFNAVRSTERTEPLDDTARVPSEARTTAGYRRNTVKGSPSATKSDLLGVNAANLANDSGTYIGPPTKFAATMTNPASAFDLRQVHYDREYSSTGEFLSLPLVGPNLLTQRLNRMRYPGFQQVSADPDNPPTTAPATLEMELVSSAEAMFLMPDFPNRSSDTAGSAVETARNNRWYRLFQFVEVPSRVHRMLGNYLAQSKIPGKLNINMIRHREVLGGLIDNPYLADVPGLADNTPGMAPGTPNDYEDGPFMTSVSTLSETGVTRDVFHDFIRDRDGGAVSSYDPIAGASKTFWIPGTPNARPFRSPGSLGTTAASEAQLDHTLLRRMRADRDEDNNGSDDVAFAGLSSETNRHWLELANTTLHADPQSLSGVIGQSSNAETRHRILSKVLNNTTTVSNCFIVYGTAAYFEVYEDPTTGLARVGGRYDLDGDGDETNDQQRAVFVIDRTDAYEAYDPGTGDFDWSRLVKSRVTIE